MCPPRNCNDAYRIEATWSLPCQGTYLAMAFDIVTNT